MLSSHIISESALMSIAKIIKIRPALWKLQLEWMNEWMNE